jgi:hypothetical protein
MKKTFKLLVFLPLLGILLLGCSKKDDNNDDNNNIPTPPATKKHLITKINLHDTLSWAYTYNASDLPSKFVYFYSPDSEYYNITYNTAGAMTKIVTSSFATITSTKNIENNSDNLPFKVIFYTIFDTFSRSFEYDANKRLTKINHYSGSDFSSTNYIGFKSLTYNTNGNVISEKYYDGVSPGTKRFEYTYEYDTANNLYTISQLQWLMFFYNEGYESEFSCSYFSKNNVTKITFDDGVNPPELMWLYSYEYNTEKFPVKRFLYGEPYEVTYIVK